MLIRSKKSSFAAKCEDVGKGELSVRKQDLHNEGTGIDTYPQVNMKVEEIITRQNRRPCSSIAFPSLKHSDYEPFHKNENKCNAYLSSSCDAGTTCKMTVGGEQSADGTAPTTASSVLLECYESPLPWRSRSRSLSSVSSVSLSSVFSMDYTIHDPDYFGRCDVGPAGTDSFKCWNIQSLLVDVLGEVLLSFKKRSAEAVSGR